MPLPLPSSPLFVRWPSSRATDVLEALHPHHTDAVSPARTNTDRDATIGKLLDFRLQCDVAGGTAQFYSAGTLTRPGPRVLL